MSKFKTNLLVTLLIFSSLVISLFFLSNPFTNKITGFAFESKSKVTEITSANQFISYLESTSIVNDLPKGRVVELKTSSKIYEIKDGKVKAKTPESPDLIIFLDTSYIKTLPKNFCGQLSKAYNNGDLTLTLQISKVSLLWNYGSFIKEYSSCLGQ